MAGKENDGGIELIGVAFVVVIIANLLSNTLNFGIIYNFGFNQYISNITDFHEDNYAKSNNNLKVYNKIIKIKDLNKIDNHMIMTKNTNFKIKGYIEKEYTNWVAVEFFKNTNKIYGYILIKNTNLNSGVANLIDKQLNKNNDFNELSKKTINNFKDKQFNIYITKVRNKYDIKKVSTPMKKQQMSENENFILLYSKKDINYYYDEINKLEVNKLYDTYSGSNYETIFLNSSKQYNPDIDGVYSENIIIKLLDSRLFNVFLIILFIITIKYYFKYLNSEKCS
jgi:hypothetical protein